MSFDDDLDAQLSADKDTRDVDVVLNGKLVTFRFVQMDALEWAAATDMFPARPKVLLDMRYGYNLRGLTPLAAARSGKRVDGDKLVELTPEQWEKLFKALPGAHVMRIGDSLFDLNEYSPGEAVVALKKELADVSALSSDLPETLESLPDDSKVGSLKSSPSTDTTVTDD